MGGKRSKLAKALIVALLCAMVYCNRVVYLAGGVDGNGTISRGVVEMPPSLALITVALGPIRGLVVDALWWRVANLQVEGEYFEILNITDWITMMNPTDSFAWVYHAWNLSSNLAYEFPTPETRWKWVEAGVKLLRDEGLKYNPGNKHIRSELAWLFLDKVGGISEPGKAYYIKQLATEMERYLKVGDRDEIEALATAKTGELARRAKALERVEGLVPSKMLEIDRRCGPFQWRLPQAQAVYWGLRDSEKDYSQGGLNYRSIVPSAMLQAFLFGRIVEDKKSGLFVTTCNFDITDSIIAFYEERIRHGAFQKSDRKEFDDFVRHAAPILYVFDRKPLAYKLYVAREKLVGGSKEEFHSFITSNLPKLYQGRLAKRYKQSIIEMRLYNAYKTLNGGVYDKANLNATRAKTEWEKYQKACSGAFSLCRLPPFGSLKAAALAKYLSHLNDNQKKRLEGLLKSGRGKVLNVDVPFSSLVVR